MKKRLDRNYWILNVISLFFLAYALLLVFPLVFAVNSALKQSDQDFLLNLTKLTTNPKFSNFLTVFSEFTISETSYMEMFGNSLWFSVGTTLFNVFSSMCLAYGVAKYKFKGREFIYSFILVIIIFPVFGTLPARYKLYSTLGFIDSPLLLISYAGAFDAQFLILYAFFKNLEWEYAEAAFIDGASHWRVFVQIMIPMALPAISTLMVTNFISSWNNYADVLLYLPNNMTLSSGIYTFAEKMKRQADRPLFYSGMIISLIPVMALFLVLQKTVMKMTFEGGLKG